MSAVRERPDDYIDDPDFPDRDPTLEGQIELWLLLRARELVFLHAIAQHGAERYILMLPIAWDVSERPSEIVKAKKHSNSIAPLHYNLELTKTLKVVADK